MLEPLLEPLVEPFMNPQAVIDPTEIDSTDQIAVEPAITPVIAPEIEPQSREVSLRKKISSLAVWLHLSESV